MFLFTVVTLAFLSFFIRIPEINGSLEGWNSASNPEYQLLKKRDSLFQRNERIMIVISPKEDSLYQTFKEVKKLKSNLLQKFPDAILISPTDFYSKMIRHWQTKNNRLDDFLKEGREVPILSQLIGKDLSSFLMIFSMNSLAEVNADEFDRILVEFNNSFDARAISSVHLTRDTTKSMKQDLSIMIVMIVLFFLLYMLFAFKSFKAIVYMLMLIAISVYSTTILFDFLGRDIEVISIIAVPIVLVLALSDSLHLLSGYGKLEHLVEKNDRLKETIRLYIVPSFFSSFTTAFAFFSFYLFGDTRFIKDFGLITAIGLLLEFFIAFLISPFLLNWINLRSTEKHGLNRLPRALFEIRKPITIAFVIVTIMGGALVSQLKIDHKLETLLPRGSQSRDLNSELNKNYFSILDASLMITPKVTLKDSVVRMDVKKIAKSCLQMEGVLNVNSATNEYYFRSKLGREVNLYNVLGDNSPFFNQKTGGYLIECQFENDEQILLFADHWRNVNMDNYQIEVVSQKLMMTKSNHMVASSLIKSLSTAGLTIFLVILLLTRSFRASLLSLFPNLVPLGFIVLFYIVLDLDMNMITSLSMVVGLGLLDDDTIHILYRRLWLKRPMEELSFSVISSGIILSITFLIFGISKFFPVQQFGLVTALIFLVGVIAELTIMVWILNKIGPRSAEDKRFPKM